MANERPQLSGNELQQLRWLLGGSLALVSIWAVWYLDAEAWPLLGLATVATFLVLWRPTLPSRIPVWLHRLAFPAILAGFAFDFYTFGQVLPSLVRLAVMLLAYRVVSYRKRRDDLQLILLGLFLIVSTGVLTVSIGFAVQIVVFTALALGLLLTRGLVDVAESGSESTDGAAGNPPPPWAQVSWVALFGRVARASDWRVWTFAVLLFASLVGVSAGLFLAIPRFQLESSLFLDRWMNRRSVTGFTDTLRFGEVSDIQNDESIAFRVEVGDPRRLPETLYWRMIVLDEYRDQSFRLSKELKLAGFGRLLTDWRLPGFGFPDQSANTTQWTFYVEPGVSRYLPLLSDFRGLVFTEPQTFRASAQLRMIELSRDPSTMKAFRVDRGAMSGTIRDPLFEHRSPMAAGRVLGRTALEVPFPAEEQTVWARAVAEILGGKKLPAAEFSRAAAHWLQAHHAYSLQSRLPKGPQDPLTRWAMSDEPGHCELFAGAFAMLARTAGFPTRIVGGFLGGTWNGDYLIVRNSGAHAWCEIFDEAGNWVRVDPTAPATGQVGGEQRPELRGALVAETGWIARLDRLRMFWYRRIVNFEQRDQVNLVKALRAGTESSSKQVRFWLEQNVQRFKRWLTQPWNLGRIASVAGPIAMGAWLTWFWRRTGRDWWLGWRASRSKRSDPIRREAGRWLERFASARRHGWESPVATAGIEAVLQRLRYGAPQSWPVPEPVFRQANRVFKDWRRAARRSSENRA
ncbi:hypothetical protein DB347_22335 [Opitutaceae bacterium EW11]|nr:hypothetical protein DB347_22335 [Opitutaceae bacterium EW11]